MSLALLPQLAELVVASSNDPVDDTGQQNWARGRTLICTKLGRSSYLTVFIIIWYQKEIKA